MDDSGSTTPPFFKAKHVRASPLDPLDISNYWQPKTVMAFVRVRVEPQFALTVGYCLASKRFLSESNRSWMSTPIPRVCKIAMLYRYTALGTQGA